MSIEQLEDIAQAIVAPGKGIIAIDESNNTIKKRFDAVGVESTEENRRAYRELLLTTPKLSDYISGAILYDETLRQSTRTGVPFTKVMADAGILPGIVVLSGGQSDEAATAHLNAMNQLGAKPWPLAFSYGRAMQQAALK
ncbi:MAG: fructose-bisphosphate aldolase class I, partial [Gammaproteobacteria bacterium]|nr:fructose-bisphosphate aldolase class I [Gammaproteobacteria bacterium]